MNDVTAAPPVVPSPSAIHPSLRHLFTAPRPAGDDHAGVLTPIELPDGDPLRVDQTVIRVYSPDEPGETGPLERMRAYVYDLTTGERLLTRALASEWWWENMGHIPEEDLRTWLRDRPNHWLATDRHLLISGGLWWRIADRPNGDLAYKSTAQIQDEYQERHRRAQGYWTKLHAGALAAFRPAWADRVEFHGDEELLEAEGLTFIRTVDRVSIRLELERRSPDASPAPGDVEGFYLATGVPTVDLSDVDDELAATDAAAVAQSITTALAALAGEADADASSTAQEA